ncbi:MAG: MBOAT family O-acyltransferase [Bacteroidota bacterium]
MLFNSLAFLAFFPIAVVGAFVTPGRWRWAWLLAMSYLFYAAWEPSYLLLIWLSTGVDYACGRSMGRRATRQARRPFLLVSLGANLGLLGIFKYAGFFADTANALFGWMGTDAGLQGFDLLLPVGISFYTFQTLSYTIDVYRGARAPERHLGVFALYVSFFPQLVAGPLERSERLLPQLHAAPRWDWPRAFRGSLLMGWGFFLKTVLADRLAFYVDAVYAAPDLATSAQAWGASYAFAFQIYGDFAGYSLIAIGAAEVLGVRLMDNFRRPYFARSIGEFWRRWHISLSFWFRDYVYVPLGGNRVAFPRWTVNIAVVFVVSGLWHGAAWTFVAWGALHGTYLIVGRLTQPARNRLWGQATRLRLFISITATFHLAVVAWVFFRAAAFGDAFALLAAMARFPSEGLAESPLVLGLTGYEAALGLAALTTVLAVEIAEERRGTWWWDRVRQRPAWQQAAVFVALVFSVLCFGEFGAQAFIYFQF